MAHAFYGDTIQMDGHVTSKGRCMQYRALPGSPVVQAAAQLGQVFFPDGKSRRHGVTAVTHQKVGAGTDAGVQVKALHAASAALALAVFINGDHDDRASGALHQPGSHAGCCSSNSSAALKICCSVSCRWALISLSLCASSSALSGSSQSTSCKAVTALSMRPAALMRGAMA